VGWQAGKQVCFLHAFREILSTYLGTVFCAHLYGTIEVMIQYTKYVVNNTAIMLKANFVNADMKIVWSI
jgi:hypothetical protein